MTPEDFLAVNRTFEHPEILVKLINLWTRLMFSDDISKNTYYRYNSTTSHLPYLSSFTNCLWPYQDKGAKDMERLAKGEIKEEDLKGASVFLRQNIEKFEEGDYSVVRYYEQYWNQCFQTPYSTGSVQRYYQDNYKIIQTEFYGTGTPTMSKMMATLDQFRDDMIRKIVTGEQPLDYFDQFVEEWYQLGGEAIVSEVNL